MSAFIETSEERLVVDQIPDAVVHFFESDVFAVESLAEEMLSGVQAEGAGVADATDFKVLGTRAVRCAREFGALSSGGDGRFKLPKMEWSVSGPVIHMLPIAIFV